MQNVCCDHCVYGLLSFHISSDAEVTRNKRKVVCFGISCQGLFSPAVHLLSKADDDCQAQKLILVDQVCQICCSLLSAAVQATPRLNSDESHAIDSSNLRQHIVEQPLVIVPQGEVDIQIV